MTIISQPAVTVNIVPATTDISNEPQRVLFVGQQTTGTATSGELQENILNDNAQDTLFGLNSVVAGMIRDARQLNKVTSFDAIGIDDNGAGVAATGQIAVTGTSTEAGTLTVVVGSKYNHSYSIAVASGDTATVIGDAIEAAVLADTRVPVTASNTTGTVTMTADNKGTIGKSIGLAVYGSVAGVTTAVTGMASGATDPSLTGVFDVVGKKRYQTVIWAFDDTSELKSFLDARFNASNDVLDGMGIAARTDTLANHLSFLNALNSQSLNVKVDKLETATNYAGPALLELPYSKAAQEGAVRALRLTSGANIAQFVITRNGALDSFGGPALASKPYFNTPMPRFNLIDTGKGFTDLEIEQLAAAGGAVTGNNTAGNTVILGEQPTTYKTDSAGNTDVTFKYVNYVDTASNAREYFFNNLKARFAQSRLTEGDLIRGRDMANPALIKAFCTGLYQDLAGEDFVLTQAGEAAIKFFKQNLSVTVDLSTGTATVQMVTPIVTQLREINATMKIAFSTEG